MGKRPLLMLFVLTALLYWLTGTGKTGGLPAFPEEADGQSVQARGILEEKTETAYGWSARIRAGQADIFIQHQSIKSTATQGESSQASIQFIVYTEEEIQVRPGERAEVSGILQLFDGARNPGQFDQAAYYAGKNIWFSVKKGRVSPAEGGRRSLFSETIASLGDYLARSAKQIMSQEDAALFLAIGLGEKRGLDEEEAELFRNGGVAHIFSVSGLHLSFFAMALYRLLRFAGLSFAAAGAASGVLAFGYASLTGMGSAAVRALLMFVFYLGSQILGRTNDRQNSLGGAGICMLLSRPAVLWESGFWLSFLAVEALALLPAEPEKRRGNAAERIGRAVAPSLAVQILTLPIVLYQYSQWSPYSILANLLITPTVAVILGTGLTGCLVGGILPAAGQLIAAPCHYLFTYIRQVCRLEYMLPGAVQITGKPSLAQVYLYYLVLAAGIGFWSLLQQGKKQKSSSGRFILSLGSMALALRILCPVQPDFAAVFLDVGQGDGMFMTEKGGLSVLVDGGSSSAGEVFGQILFPALKAYGIDRLDYVMVTHGDQDHCSGILEFLEDYQINLAGKNSKGITIGCLVLPAVNELSDNLKKAVKLAEEKHIPVKQMGQGGEIRGDRMSLTCLYPESDADSDGNETSLVLHARYKTMDILLTGDLEGEGEKNLVKSGLLSRVDLLKVAHHGSKNSTGREFLARVIPQAALISCGKDNSYGHPHEELLERLEESGAQIWTTARQGALVIER